MKKIALLITFVCISMFGFAQKQMAVLQHDETITTYYGIDAFVEAYENANDGDTITLSAGNFNMVEDIEKTITLYGAGCKPENGFQSTYFNQLNNWGISISINSDYYTLHIEGVDFGFNKIHLDFENCNAQFVKCILHCYDTSCDDCKINFCNCLITNNSNFYFEENCTVNIINSVIFKCENLFNCNVYNSYISLWGSVSESNKGKSLFNNCIISYQNGENSNESAYSTNIFSNCVAIGMPNFYDNLNGGIGTNIYKSEMLDVFETFDGNYTDSEGNFNYNEEYNLNNSFNFLGYDGTEVGLHGGMMPFSLSLSYMIIKKCIVASKTTIDGKLSVDIEIDTEK